MSFTLLIDPGHGGDNTGCTGNGLVEKDITLAVGMTLASMARAAGINVLMSRSQDVAVSLSERAVQPEHDLTLVLHCDTSPTWPGNLAVYTRHDDRAGFSAATVIDRAAPGTVRGIRPKVRLTSPGDWTNRAHNCLMHHAMPAVLIEMGFLSNPLHATFLSHPVGRASVASALLLGATVVWNMGVMRDAAAQGVHIA